MAETRVFAPRGVCALEPTAFGLEWAIQCAADPFTIVGTTAVIDVCGPLSYRKTPDAWFQTYAEITCAVRAACEASGVRTVLLKIASPGGEVHGAFDCAREVRAIADASGKRLVAYSDAQACSAAYAIAAAAHELSVSDTAVIGSIGVIAMLVESTGLDDAMGLRFSVVTSGARKADGNPHVHVSDGAIAATQSIVDATAQIFFDHVAAFRGISGEDVAAQQAGLFVGANAVSNRLADSIESYSAVLGRLSNSPPVMSTETITMDEDDKDKPKEDAVRAALVTASESDDADKATKAKRALAAYDAEQEEEPKKDDDEKKDSQEASSSAVASAVAPLAKQLAAQQAELASLKAKADAADRSAIFAARPDLSAELIKSLEATPTSALKAVVDQIPAPKGFVNLFVGTAAAKPVQGGQGGRPQVSANHELNKRMGLVNSTKEITYRNGSQLFGEVVEGGNK